MSHGIRPTVICGVALAAVLVTACAEDRSAEPDAAGIYTQGTSSADGIGKYYMGRHISRVMGHRGAAWLDRPTREQEERTDRLVANLPLDDDTVVADIGAGTGYFSLRIARRVPSGRVYAVDISPEMLALLETRMQDAGIANVVLVQATETSSRLPRGAVDLALIVDAYHEFSHPREVMVSLYDALKPGGRVVLVEYRGEDPTVPIRRLHKMTQEQAVRELEAAGFEWERTEDFLPQQHFMVFRRR